MPVIAEVREGCAMYSFFSASVILPVSATVTTYHTALKSCFYAPIVIKIDNFNTKHITIDFIYCQNTNLCILPIR